MELKICPYQRKAVKAQFCHQQVPLRNMGVSLVLICSYLADDKAPNNRHALGILAAPNQGQAIKYNRVEYSVSGA